MKAGRFVCVALPLALCLASIIALLYAVLAGVSHRNLHLFEIDLSDLKIDAEEIQKIIKNLDLSNLPDNIEAAIKDNIDDINLDGVDTAKLKEMLPDGKTLDDVNVDGLKEKLSEAGDSLDNIDINSILKNSKRSLEPSSIVVRDTIISAGSLGLGAKYEVSLWGYCRIDNDGGRNCTSPEFNWAEKRLNTDAFEKLIDQTGIDIELPDELDDSLDVFKKVSKWTQVAFVICLLALAVEFIIGVFANCTRVVSCLVWLWAGITTIIVIITATLATVTAAVVVGAVESVGHKWDANASIDTGFLATIWLGAAFSIAAGLFWIFTICCCKPESRAERKMRKRQSETGEKLLPGNQYGSYGRIQDENQLPAHPTGYSSANPGYNNYGYNAPSYPQPTRDVAYEPYSSRA